MKSELIAFIILILLITACSIDDRQRNLANERFKGYEKITDKEEGTPEIIPDYRKMMTISVPPNLSEYGINMDNLLDSVFYVRLETNDNSLIGDIDKLLFYNDTIIVIEKIKRQSILLFTSKGKFISKVGDAGKGAGEYLSVTDVTVDFEKRNIIVLDDRSKKLIFYDLGGRYIRDQKILYFSKSISMLKDGSFLIKQLRGLNNHLPFISDYNLIFAQRNLKITGKAISFDYRDKFSENKLESNNNFNVTKNGVIFNPSFSDTIYEIGSNNKISAKYCINLGEKNIRLAFNEKTKTEDVLKLLNTWKYYSFDGKALESDNYLYLNIDGQGFCYYSMKKDTLYSGSSWEYTNNHIISYVDPIATFNNFYVGVLQPSSIIYQLKNRKFPTRYDPLIKTLKIEDNPILFFYSLK